MNQSEAEEPWRVLLLLLVLMNQSEAGEFWTRIKTLDEAGGWQAAEPAPPLRGLRYLKKD